MRKIQIVLLSFLSQFVVAQEELHHFDVNAGDLSYILEFDSLKGKIRVFKS